MAPWKGCNRSLFTLCPKSLQPKITQQLENHDLISPVHAGLKQLHVPIIYYSIFPPELSFTVYRNHSILFTNCVCVTAKRASQRRARGREREREI